MTQCAKIHSADEFLPYQHVIGVRTGTALLFGIPALRELVTGNCCGFITRFQAQFMASTNSDQRWSEAAKSQTLFCVRDDEFFFVKGGLMVPKK